MTGYWYSTNFLSRSALDMKMRTMYGGMMKKGLLRICMAGVIVTAASSSLFATVFVGGMSDIFLAGLGPAGTAAAMANMGNYPTLGVAINPGAGQTISFNS